MSRKSLSRKSLSRRCWRWRSLFLRKSRPIRFCLLCWFTSLCVFLSPGLSARSITPQSVPKEIFHRRINSHINSQAKSWVAAQAMSQTAGRTLAQRSRIVYESGRFAEAAALLQEAVTAHQQQGNPLAQAIALSNLALTYQQLGSWQQANEAIQNSLSLLFSVPQSTQRTSGIAQTLDIRGQLQFAQGRAEQALASWQQAAERYKILEEGDRLVQNQINQSRALQTLGFHQKALTLLNEQSQMSASAPDSLAKAAELRSLGEGLRAVGNLEESRSRLEESLAIAQALPANPETIDKAKETIALIQLSLGNTARAGQDSATALDWYQQAAANSAETTQLQANLNRLSLLVEDSQSTSQSTEAKSLLPKIQHQLETLPLSRTTVYARINLAESLTRTTGLSSLDAATLLSTAVKQSEQLGDRRTQSYALGLLGGRYEQTQQWSSAKDLTQQALRLATAANATDITYLWQWQMGRILKAQFEQTEAQPERLARIRTAAIASYQQAIETLQSLRLDIASINPDQQFSFRESVEPAYREQIALLLHPAVGEPQQADLSAAREALESLQTVELQNFFREACIDVPVAIDRVVEQTQALSDRTNSALAAVVYPIILENSLEVILKLPNQNELVHYSTAIDRQNVEKILIDLRNQITQPESQIAIEALSSQVYDWLIRPAEPTLERSQVGTLVFVLDGFLKNIPMAALYDGERYLVETYGIALTPGLELLNPQPIERRGMRLLFAGLSDSVEDFAPLTAVEAEREGIAAEVPKTTVLLNQSFTADALEEKIEQTSFQVVHLATHGEFSSDLSKTFLRSRDRRISMNELNNILQVRQTQSDPIELLTLSACQTAEGDERAALGLAGIAVRAGARSTLASLWGIDDRASAFLMTEFYRQLVQNPTFSKSQALRQAQLKLVTHPNYNHPSYWAPYVLLGNWL